MTRTCKECGQKFFGASSILQHRIRACGGPEVLKAQGFVKTQKGWMSPQRYKFETSRQS